MIKTYRKKPVEIKACKWTGENKNEIIDFAGDAVSFLEVQKSSGVFTTCAINTLEGRMTANIGDYIICGIKGEFYPCKPDVFEKTYEEVDSKCSHYEHLTREKPIYDVNSGAIKYHTTTHYGVCNGTKERDECYCGGDKDKCDFYKE